MVKKLLFLILLLNPVLAFANSEEIPRQQTQTSDAQPAILTENPDVEAQVSGKYNSLRRQESLPLGAIQHAWDAAKPGSGVYHVNFNAREIICLVTREYMTTSVIFPAWETINSIVIGDEASYQVTKPKPNVILLRPNEFVGVDSSMTAFGESGNVYGFYVRSEGYNSQNISDITVHIKVPAPKQILAGKKKGHPYAELFEKTEYLESVAFDPSQINFAYTMAGDKTIAPERVFTDGVRTWFDFGDKIASKTLPTIYSVLDGVDTPINVAREGNKLVAQATGIFTLRSGKKVTCVYPSKHS